MGVYGIIFSLMVPFMALALHQIVRLSAQDGKSPVRKWGWMLVLFVLAAVLPILYIITNISMNDLAHSIAQLRYWF